MPSSCHNDMNLAITTGLLFLALIFDSVINNALAVNIPGKHELGMRTRFQQVEDAWLGDAQAFTTRLKLTSSFILDDNEQWQFLLEPNFVYAFNDGDFNSVAIKKTTSPIPDPQGFNWSKINLHYDSDNDWQLTLGRQALAFENERFVGKIEFWQTPQNFDALMFDYNDQVNWHLQYAYSNKVQRIFGQDSTSTIPKEDIRYGIVATRPANELGEHKLAAHLVNLSYITDNDLSLTAYGYLVNNKDFALFSTNTFGIKVSDEFKPNKLKYRYTAEFASQKGAYNNPKSYQTWYSLLEASVQYKSHIVKLSQEVLSENNNQGFVTPLGTNHKFQGWADIFTVYGMQSGMRDQYFTYKGRYKKFRWRSVYHTFKNYQSSEVIGNELDIELAYRYTRKWEFKLVYADYRTEKGLKYFPKASNDLSTWFASVAYNI